MIPADLYDIGREALLLVFLLSLPVLLAALLSGLITGLLQAFTKMTDPTINHVARVAAVFIVLLVTLPWLGDSILAFATRAWGLLQLVRV